MSEDDHVDERFRVVAVLQQTVVVKTFLKKLETKTKSF